MASRKEHYKDSCVLGFSIAQIVLGVACIILQGFLILERSSLYFVGQGIWAGFIFFIAGILGIFSSHWKNSCTIIAFLVMAIFAAVVAVCGLIAASAVELGVYEPAFSIVGYFRTDKMKLTALSATMVAIAILQAILAIVSSAMACHGLCGRDDTHIANHAEEGHVENDSRGRQTIVH